MIYFHEQHLGNVYKGNDLITCSSCLVEKETFEFYINKKQCKVCTREKQKLNRDSNKDREYLRRKKWEEDNSDYVKIRASKYYSENKDIIKKNCLEYKSKNKDKYLAYNKNHQSMVRAGLRKLSFNERAKINLIYIEAQQVTIQTGIQYHVDHIIPISKGGEHVCYNLQVITATENLKKGSSLPMTNGEMS